MKFKMLSLISLYLFCFYTYAQKKVFQKELERVAEKIDTICSPWSDGPGGVVGIVQNGKLVLSKAYGKACLEFDAPITENTMFNIASVSKQFTAFAIILLENEGKLNIDDEIQKHLPELPYFKEPITIRHLLTHTSGLRNFQDLLAMAGWRNGDPIYRDDVLHFISNQKELNFSPGSKFLYCNTGFVLATFIIERISGKSFQDWTKEYIFNPLGMNNTEFRENMEAVMNNTAFSYDPENGRYMKRFGYYNFMGNGNLYTTIGDMAKWVSNFDNPVVGGTKSIEKLTERYVLKTGDTVSYALGIGINKHRGVLNWSHGGSVGGYRARTTFVPGTNTGFIALSNFSRGNPNWVVTQLMEEYLKDLMEPDKKQKSRYPALSKSIPVSKASFQAISGHYLINKSPIELYESKGKFYMKSEDSKYLGIELLAASDTSFFAKKNPISIFINPGDRNIEKYIVINTNGNVKWGRKYSPKLSKVEHLAQFEGTYYSPELDTSYTFVIKDGKLIGTHQRQPDFNITPYSSNYMRANGFFVHEINVERFDNKKIKAIRISSNRAKNVLFLKQ